MKLIFTLKLSEQQSARLYNRCYRLFFLQSKHLLTVLFRSRFLGQVSFCRIQQRAASVFAYLRSSLLYLRIPITESPFGRHAAGISFRRAVESEFSGIMLLSFNTGQCLCFTIRHAEPESINVCRPIFSRYRGTDL